MIIILNDNEMSISKNISGMNKLLTRLRTKKNYRKSNEKGKKVISSIPLVGTKIISGVSKIKGMIKQLFIPKMYFEEIGIKYLGPVDGHNIVDLESILTKAKDFDEPVIIHVLTKKGKGYKFAEENPTKFHGIGPFNIDTGETKSKKGLDYSAVFGNKLISLAKKNKKIVAITAAMKDGVGLNNFATLYPERFFDVGIAEQHAITFAAGLAKDGMIPFVSIYSSFYQRCYDQIIHDVCMQNLPVIMCVDRAGIVGQDGETHQGILDMAFFKIVPNLVLMMPKDFNELEDMIELAISLKKPVVIRYPRGGESNSITFRRTPLKFGKSEIIEQGDDITIISCGNFVVKALNISAKLKENNIYADVINVRFLKPLDTQIIKESILKSHKVIVMEDGINIGGLCSSIKELIIDEKMNDVIIKTYAYPDEFINHGTIQELEKKYKIDENSILRDIKGMFK